MHTVAIFLRNHGEQSWKRRDTAADVVAYKSSKGAYAVPVCSKALNVTDAHADDNPGM